ncbi:MAG: transposase [Smithella sp.]
MSKPNKYQRLVKPRLYEIKEWARNGVIDADIATRLGIVYSTLRIYVAKYPELVTALEDGKAQPNNKVESNLYLKTEDRIITLEKPIKVKETIFDPNTGRKLKEIEKIEYAHEEVHIPADTAAIIFYLCNRLKEFWKNKQLTQVMVSDLAKYLDSLKGEEF